jgi:spermidine synthase
MTRARPSPAPGASSRDPEVGRRSAAPRPPTLKPVTLSEHRGVRYLHLDSIWVQGAMRMADPDRLELEYVRRMMAWMLGRPVDEVTRGHAMQLGLGAGAITRFCHGPLRMTVTAVEVNPTVIEACRMWFHLPGDGPRLAVLNADAREVVADPARGGTVDVLCVDLYDHEAAGPVLDSLDFYRDCAALLRPGGVMSVNLFGRNARFERSVARIGRAFGHAADADRLRTVRPTAEGNTTVIALRESTWPARDVLVTRAENIETRFGLPARRWVRLLRTVPVRTTPGPHTSSGSA